MYLSEYYCFTSVRITCRIDTKKREAQLLLLASHLEARRNCPVCRNEQRRKPHADMLKHLTHLTQIGIRIHQRQYGIVRACL